MELRALRYAVTLADELHFGRAARRHFISAQPFGQVVRRLERELGVLLFERTSRRVALTEAGERFVARARAVLLEVDALTRPESLTQLDTLTGLDARSPSGDNVVTVGVLGVGLAERWPTLWRLVLEQQPGLHLEYRDLDLVAQYDAVRAGEVDVAVVLDVGPVDGLVLDPVAAFDTMAVVPTDSTLAHADRLTLAELLEWPMLTVPQPGTLLSSWLAIPPIRPAAASAAASVRAPAAVAPAVALTGRVAVHIEPARRFYPHPGAAYVPLEAPPGLVAIASRTDDRRPAIAAFRTAARQLGCQGSDRNGIGC
jgi:DNA-binding transcriptional LysR family regulator